MKKNAAFPGMIRLITAFVFALFVFANTALYVFAGGESVYVNEETGYAVYIDDAENLIDEAALLEIMIPVTAYGGAAFVSARANTSAAQYAQDRYREYFGTDSGTLFLIDMKGRYLWIFSDGAVWQSITTPMANTITDNVYRYASRGNYDACAQEAFTQITMVLANRRIAQPMKHINNALLALFCAFLLNFWLAVILGRKEKPDPAEMAKAHAWSFVMKDRRKEKVSNSKTYKPLPQSDGGGSSSSGGGGGGRSFGGGGGSFSGSSSSGGGGGHRF